MADVVIVEDELASRLYLEKLVTHLDHNVQTTFDNATSAIDFCSGQSNMDVVIIDVRLSAADEMEGLEVADTIKECSNGDVTIIMVSGFEQSYIEEHFDTEIDYHYLRKPFKKHHLEKLIDQS